MKDIQSQPDSRRIDIQKVGVKDIVYPVTVFDKQTRVQQTVARVNMYVNLPHRFKGTHMSRFVEILNRFHGEIHVKRIGAILREMKARLEAEAAHLEIAFPLFLPRQGRTAAGRVYRCAMYGSIRQRESLTLEVEVPISPPAQNTGQPGLPPAPGRWGRALARLGCSRFLWIEDLVTTMETVVARAWADHRYQGQPLAVERLTTALGSALAAMEGVTWFRLRVENFAKGYATFAVLEHPAGATGGAAPRQ